MGKSFDDSVVMLAESGLGWRGKNWPLVISFPFPFGFDIGSYQSDDKVVRFVKIIDKPLSLYGKHI
jgi:hypothetical protein